MIRSNGPIKADAHGDLNGDGVPCLMASFYGTGDQEYAESDMKPNIILMVWDATRAKNLPFYGYHRNTTPFLKSIERDLSVYRNAISSSYWTLPSITSIFTGMHSSSHGLLVDGDTINPSLFLLSEILGHEGYSCGAFNRNPYVSSFSGLDKGFHEYVSDARCLWDYLKQVERRWKKRFSTDPSQVFSVQDTQVSPDGDTTVKRRMIERLKHVPDAFTDSGSRRMARLFSKWVREKTKENKPIFAFFQTIETHSPYRTPLRFSLKYLTPAEIYQKICINQDHLSFLLGKTRMTESDFSILRNAYDNAILYSDSLTGLLIQTLKDEKIYENTLFILLADHGESIGEHDLMFHIWSLYDNLIKVPLVIKYPKDLGMTGQVEAIVQNTDILPTILTLLGKPNHPAAAQLQGNSLVDGSIVNRDPDIAISELIKPFGPDKMAYRSQLSKYDRRLLSVRNAHQKFIYSSRGDHEFYDLAKDPEEMSNLYDESTVFTNLDTRAKIFYQRMEDFYQQNRAHIEMEKMPQIEDESIKEQLRQLGYL